MRKKWIHWTIVTGIIFGMVSISNAGMIPTKGDQIKIPASIFRQSKYSLKNGRGTVVTAWRAIEKRKLERSELNFDVGYSQGSFNMHVSLLERPNQASGANIFLIHGFAHNARFLKPLQEAIMNDPLFYPGVKRVFAADLPGHGSSAWPGDLIYADKWR